MAVDNDESGAQCHEDGSRGDQLMAVDNDESGVQDHEDDHDDGFAELELLLEWRTYTSL